MQPSDRAEFKALLTDALSFYRQDVSKFALQVWWQACERFSMEQVAKALTAHAMDPDRGQFAPKPADIVRQLQGTKTDRSLQAWGKVMDAMQRVGAYTDVVFDDPVIHAALVDLGSWPKLCRTSFDDLSYLQHRFCEGYRAHLTRGVTEYPARLQGDRSSDEMFAKRGLPPPTPALIGDPAQAQEVMRLGVASTALTINRPAVLALGQIQRNGAQAA